MTQPDPPLEDEDPADEENETWNPDEHPHPLRAKDVSALIAKEVG